MILAQDLMDKGSIKDPVPASAVTNDDDTPATDKQMTLISDLVRSIESFGLGRQVYGQSPASEARNSSQLMSGSARAAGNGVVESSVIRSLSSLSRPSASEAQMIIVDLLKRQKELRAGQRAETRRSRASRTQRYQDIGSDPHL